jgi:ATP-dependent 26S proteasome regulatory subunit
MADQPKEDEKKDGPIYTACEADTELENLIRARYNLIYAVTWEERRVIDSLAAICDKEDINLSGVQVWDAARGLMGLNNVSVEGGAEMVTPDLVLNHIMQKAEEARGKVVKAKASRGPIYVLCDIFRYLSPAGLTPDVERKIRVLSTLLKRSTITVVMTSPHLELPTALEKCVTVLDYPLPAKQHLLALVKHAKTKLVERGKLSKEGAEQDDETVVRALQGLTIQEAEDALAKAVIVKKRFDIPTILEIKRGIIRKGGLLDFIPANDNLSDIGGFQGVKEFVKLRKDAFSDNAKEYGLPDPKGIFLMGIQGTGKSLCARAVAHELQIPLLKLDMGSMFGELMGESEKNMRKALAQAESIAPCVLFVDEIDKALAGATGAGSNDGGTTKRVIGKMLDWMQSKSAPVFVVACANSLLGLPPALIRKGRFDERFFVDFPTPEEREEIFKIHLKKRKRDPEKFDITKLVGLTDKYIGAEIEGVIVDAMYAAYGDNKREFTTQDIIRAIRGCRKMADVLKTEIDMILEEAKGKLKNASDPLNSLEVEDSSEGSRFQEI